MTFITAEKPALRLSAIAFRPFAWVWNLLVAISEAHPKMAQVNKLNAQTDEELAALGTTREAEVRRIFSSQSYI